MNRDNKPQESCDLSQALYTYALKLTANHRQAKELIQQTTHRIKQVATLYTPTIDFATWARFVMENTLHTTVKNADINELCHTAYNGTLNPMRPDLDKEYTLKEQIYMMSLLTPHQAAATTLRLRNNTLDAISRKMNITTIQVKEHLTQARNILNHAWDN